MSHTTCYFRGINTLQYMRLSLRVEFAEIKWKRKIAFMFYRENGMLNASLSSIPSSSIPLHTTNIHFNSKPICYLG